MQKVRVGVLMGGKSIEAEVSFNSGRTICDHLDSSSYTVIPIFQKQNGDLFILPLRFLHRGKIADFQHRLEDESEKIIWDDLSDLIDFAYIAMHGRYAEDGTLQGMLEILNIPYLGSKIGASAISMDKIMQKKVMVSSGITVPESLSLTPDVIEKIDEKNLLARVKKINLDFPLIVKPNREGSSLGVSLVKNIDKLLPAIKHASTIHPGRQQAVLIEEKIEGMEFSCIILTNAKTGKPILLPPTEIAHEEGADFFDYEQKYMPGRAEKFTPARCEPEIIDIIQQTCLKVMQTLEFSNMARIDGFVSGGKIIIIDPNSLSGMAPSSFLFREAAEINMNHTQVINHLIETELHEYGMMNAQRNKTKTNSMKNIKKRIAVLFGGNSAEKEISLESGRNILYKLSPQNYEAIPLFVNKNFQLFQIDNRLLVRNSTQEIEDALTKDIQVKWNDLPSLCDFVFIGLHGGKGENGAVQGTLEMLGMPYNGSSVLASSLCMNKFKTNQFLKSQGFDVPKGVLISKEDLQNITQQSSHPSTSSGRAEKTFSTAHPDLSINSRLKAPSKAAHPEPVEGVEGYGWLKNMSFPLIIKPHDDGCSIGVTKAENETELQEKIQEIFALGKSHALIEECITGMELTVGVIGNENPKALPPSQAVAADGLLSIQEKFLPGAGENQTPAPLPPDALKFVQKTIEDVYKTIGCKGYARIDCFYQSPQESPTADHRCIIIEINTLPGMTPATCIFHQADELGISPMEFIDQIIELGMEEHATAIVESSKHSVGARSK